MASANVAVRYGPDGLVYLQSRDRLNAYPMRLTERLEYWADRAGQPILRHLGQLGRLGFVQARVGGDHCQGSVLGGGDGARC